MERGRVPSRVQVRARGSGFRRSLRWPSCRRIKRGCEDGIKKRVPSAKAEVVSDLTPDPKKLRRRAARCRAWAEKSSPKRAQRLLEIGRASCRERLHAE